MGQPEQQRIGKDVLDHLRKEPVLGSIIDKVGPIEYTLEADLWRAVTGSIVGQQLSVAAAATIRGRVAALGDDGYPTPSTIAALPDETLRGCGLSRAKVTYVRDAARAWMVGDVDPSEFPRLPDEEVIEKLVKLRGVGRWTAEMVLIFSLGRPDVLAVDDLGIRAAVQRAYELPERPGKLELERIAEPWRPYRSHASRYLWRSLKLPRE